MKTERFILSLEMVLLDQGWRGKLSLVLPMPSLPRILRDLPVSARFGPGQMPGLTPPLTDSHFPLCCFCVAEFDKFLEERAKAAEMVPNLPSPPLEAPTPPANPPGRKKQERSEDALFAL